MSLLKQIKERNLMAVSDAKVEKWEDSIAIAVKPLIDQGSVEAGYVDDVIANVSEFGPYICIVPRICIPHAMARNNVKTSNISFVKFNNPVDFQNEDNQGEQFISTLFFAIAAKDADEHMQNLMMLMEALDNPELIDKLCEAKTVEELNAIIDALED